MSPALTRKFSFYLANMQVILDIFSVSSFVLYINKDVLWYFIKKRWATCSQYDKNHIQVSYIHCMYMVQLQG